MDEMRLNNPLSCPICGCREVGLYEKRIPEDPEDGVIELEYSIKCPDCHVQISAGTAREVVERWNRYAEGRSE